MNLYGKKYYSLDAWCKENYGHKLYKAALDIGCTCPNRDGTLSHDGCIFCSAGGSGDFATSSIEAAIEKISVKWPDSTESKRVIAYFQSYTNTYGDADRLSIHYENALKHDSVAGISIGTRPDCISDEIIDILVSLKERYYDKFIWIELGLQSIHDSTAAFINRGYEYPVFLDAMNRLAEANLPVIVHVIIGLPHETNEMLLKTIDELNRLHPFGVKLQLLHVLDHTKLGEMYKNGEIKVMEKDEYVDTVIDCIKRLSPDICIHRITGDGPKDILLAPRWSLDKRGVLNAINSRLAKSS